MLKTVSTMFKKVMIKLTVLNATVLLMVFIVYSTVIYTYINNKLFDTIDSSMVQAVRDFSGYNAPGFPYRPFQGENGKNRNPHPEEDHRKPPPLVDLRILVVAEDVDGRVLLPQPNEKIDVEDVAMLLANTNDNIPQSKTINEHNYRILSISYSADSYPMVRVGKEKMIAVKRISAITVADPEVNMLRRLVVIIMFGTVLGFFVIIGAAYYLARRALVPIKASWDKQQQFVTDASHELRTPIAVIKLNTELLLHNPDHTIEEESIRIAGILKESNRMGKLVATLLTLARADSNQIEMNLSTVLLPKLISDIIQGFQPIAKMKEIEIKTDIDPLMEVMGDKERLHQLLVILLDNAVKYTSQGGCITVTGYSKNGLAQLFIKDTGIGISAEELPFIFERFYRGDKVRSRDDGGSGLGLAIAKWIVEKHGGKIHVESIKGQGCEFQLQLPLEKKHE